MAKTKVAISATVTLAHPDGTKLSKSKIKARLHDILTEDLDDAYAAGMEVTKVTIRDVDFD